MVKKGDSEGPRALLTPRERAIVSGDADDVSENYRYQTVSRVRRRFLDNLEDDMAALEAHGDLADEVRNMVCENAEEEKTTE